MNGPQHFHEAERHLEWVNGIAPGIDDEGVRVRLAMAQVHATLALAAATALPASSGSMPTADWKAWIGTASAHERPNSPEATA